MHVEKIKELHLKFLKKRNQTYLDYLNISKAQSKQQLEKIIGIEIGIKKALDESEIILTENEIKLLTSKVLERTAFEKENDPRLTNTFERPSYYNHDVHTMLTKIPWWCVRNEYKNMMIDYERYGDNIIEPSIEIGYSLGDLA